MTDDIRLAGNTSSGAAGQCYSSPHLDSLLAKLRPFQRTAFEFAVHGDEKRSEGSNPSATYNNIHSHSRGRRPVAGAGTGRILLGDEMGLGCVDYRLFIFVGTIICMCSPPLIRTNSLLLSIVGKH